MNPLGLGDPIEEAVENYTIDEHVHLRQQALRDRFNELSSTEVFRSTVLLESRQWDYRPRMSNPLFTTIAEPIRGQILAKQHDDDLMAAAKTMRESPKTTARKTANVRRRSCSFSSSANYLSEVNKDIKAIQTSRKAPHANGCTCQHKKMDKWSAGKMREELIQHGHLIGLVDVTAINAMNKVSLLAKLREAQKISDFCLACTSEECSCFVNGIPCAGGACGCLKDAAYPTANGTNDAIFESINTVDATPTAVMDCKLIHTSCANPHGIMPLFNVEAVRRYRAKILSDENLCLSCTENSALRCSS